MIPWWVATLGCAKVAPVPVVVQSVPPPCAVAPLLEVDEASWAAPLPVQQAAAERWAGDPRQRLNLALLLVLGAPEIRDEARALALLADGEGGADLVFGVVQSLLRERRAHEAAQEAAAASRAAERAEREALEARVRAMKAIDREMDARELGGPGDGEDPRR